MKTSSLRFTIRFLISVITMASSPWLSRLSGVVPEQAALGQIGGTTYTVALAGRYAYVAVGTRVAVVDVSDRTRPVFVGQSAPLSNVVMGIVLSGSYAYVATQAGFSILDLSDPVRPNEVGSNNAASCAWVELAGNLAYLACGSAGLRIVDVSNPTRPREVGACDTPGFAEAVTLAGRYAYVADQASGLRIIDISNPTRPVEVGFYDTPADAWHVQVVGRYAYVADHQRGNTTNGGLRILDVSNPASVSEVGSLIFGDGAHGVTVVDGHAFLARDSGRLSVIDISNVTRPVEVGTYLVGAAGGEALKVVVSNNHAFVAVSSGEMHIVDVANRNAPKRAAVWSHSGPPSGVAVSGGVAYLAVPGRGLQLINVSSPDQPTELGSLAVPGIAVRVAVAERYAYVAVGAPFNPVCGNCLIGSLRIVDVSNPAMPIEVGAFSTAGYAQAVVVSGRYAYLATSQSGLQIIDISDPARPVEAGRCDTPGVAEGVAVAGSYAYVADGNSGLRVIDVSDPVRSREVGFFDTPGYSKDVAIAGSRAYVADQEGGLRVIDVSTPSRPSEVGVYVPRGTTVSVAVSGIHAYLAVYGRNLLVVDVSNPAQPREADALVPYFQYAQGVAVVGSNAYLAAADGGFVIARFAVALTITTQPSNQTVMAGSNGSFAAAAGGTPTPTYQWQVSSNNGSTWTDLTTAAPYGGVTTATLTITSATVGLTGNQYRAVATNSVGAITSNAATLTVSPIIVTPSIVTQPASQTANVGGSVTFSVVVSGTPAPTFQWRKDGVNLAGATSASYTISSVQASDPGSYTVVVTNASRSTTSGTATLALAVATNPGRLINLSILTDLSAAEPSFTVGTVIGGAGSSGGKPLLVRAAGPSLEQLGVGGALPDPKLDLFSGQTVIASNDNWTGTAALSAVFTQVGAFSYVSGTSKDAAISNAGMLAGAYTIQVGGVGGATGAVLAELYDATPTNALTATTPRLINVSVLKQINAGRILTAGFVIGGSTTKPVLIRAVGPTLGASPFGVAGAMDDPKFDLFSGQTVINRNDNWGGGAALSSVFASVGAFALGATSRDAALLVTLNPGSYTVQVSGVGGTSGVALIEIYEVP